MGRFVVIRTLLTRVTFLKVRARSYREDRHGVPCGRVKSEVQ